MTFDTKDRFSFRWEDIDIAAADIVDVDVNTYTLCYSWSIMPRSITVNIRKNKIVQLCYFVDNVSIILLCTIPIGTRYTAGINNLDSIPL